MQSKYRPNVAALLVNQEGLLLICERAGMPGAWQFPQGGVDDGETAPEALRREVTEEVGYSPDDYAVEESKGGYRYDYPPEALDFVRAKRGVAYVGQEQCYFLCRLVAGAKPPMLDGREFLQYKWIRPGEFKLEWLPPFKRDVYRRVLQDFFGVDFAS